MIEVLDCTTEGKCIFILHTCWYERHQSTENASHEIAGSNYSDATNFVQEKDDSKSC